MASSAPKTSKKGATWAVGLGIGRARAVMGDRLRSKRGEAPCRPSGQNGKGPLRAEHHSRALHAGAADTPTRSSVFQRPRLEAQLRADFRLQGRVVPDIGSGRRAGQMAGLEQGGEDRPRLFKEGVKRGFV